MSSETPNGPPPATEPRREKKSRAGWIAALFVLALAGWMGSGYYYPSDADMPVEQPSLERQPMLVEVTRSFAKPVTEFIVTEGQALPDRLTPVRAKVGGTVESIAAEKGAFLEKGALIATLALGERAAQREQAEALVVQQRRELARITDLADQGFATAAQLDEARAALASAEAALAEIRETAGDTEIRAPITGVLNAFDLDIGEFVAAGAEVGTQIDIDPLVVEAQIPQQSVAEVRKGQTAEVLFITGQAREGTVAYVSANATQETRTFPVEIEVPNPERDVPSGISAQIRLPTGETPAHFVSPALLALGPEGDLGIKAVDEDNTVAFYPVEIVRAETDGIWVAGLPDRLDIISIGQGFVSAGETVRVKQASPAAGETAPEAPENAPKLVSDASAVEGTAQWESSPKPAATVDASASGADDAETASNSDGQTGGNGTAVQADEAPSVRSIQRRLRSLGYEPGPIDGVLGASTRAAIRKFQADQGLDVTGTTGAEFSAALFGTRLSRR